MLDFRWLGFAASLSSQCAGSLTLDPNLLSRYWSIHRSFRRKMGRMSGLNERAHELCEAMVAAAPELRIAVRTLSCGTRLIDCGVEAAGDVEAGRRLAEVCLSGLGSVEIALPDPSVWGGDAVRVTTDEPVAACMASQYAGWEVKGEKFFAMGSGPMRAAAGREPLFDEIDCHETPEQCVGVLESGTFPPERVCEDIAAKCGIAPERLTLCVARTSSPAGTVQIVARSVETALHKLHELGFDLHRVVHGTGWAPLPPLVSDDLAAVGRTNDAILYGGFVELSVSGDDASLEAIGPRVPSSASPDFGRPFAEVFARHDHDFYRIDRQLFSPAVVVFRNRDTGQSFSFGQAAPDVLADSFTKKK
jgi:methenyltetrahydromethanopterin cyclohydrolase